MKILNLKTALLFAALAGLTKPTYSFTVETNDSNRVFTKPRTPGLGWEISFGGNFLTNTALSHNRSLSDGNVSGSYGTYLDLALGGKRKTGSVKGFSLRPGISTHFRTFGLNKLIVDNNGRSQFESFQPGRKYDYSCLEMIVVNVPVGIAYHLPLNKNKKSYGFELSAIPGYMVYNEKRYSELIGRSSVTTTGESVSNLNHLQYSLRAKISSRNYFPGGKMGYEKLVSFGYYFNDVFSPANNTPAKSYSVLLGVGLFLN